LRKQAEKQRSPVANPLPDPDNAGVGSFTKNRELPSLCAEGAFAVCYESGLPVDVTGL